MYLQRLVRSLAWLFHADKLGYIGDPIFNTNLFSYPSQSRVSPKASLSRPTKRSRSATPERFEVHCPKELEQSYSDNASGSSPLISKSTKNGVREVSIRNVKPGGSIRELAESSDDALQVSMTTEIDQLGHTGVSDSAEHELDDESPPLSPVKLTRIDSVGSDLEAYTHQPSNHPVFTSEIVDPPYMFSSDVGEATPRPHEVHHGSGSSVTKEDEDLFNELMKTDSEIPCPQSEDLDNVFGTPGSSLSRNLEVVKSVVEQSASAFDGDRQTNGRPSEELHAPPFESIVEAATPKASPFGIRRWAVKTHVSQLSPDSDLQATPTASPHVNKRVTSSNGVSSTESSVEDVSSIIEPPFAFKAGKMSFESHPRTESPILPIPPDFDEVLPVVQNAEPFRMTHNTAVVRRHSFGSRTRNMLNRKRDGSHSDGNSPNGSPALHPQKRGTKSQQKSSTMSVLRRHHSEVHRTKKRPISVLGLISTTRSDLSLEDLPSVCNHLGTDLLAPGDTIVPPPEQFEEPISVAEQENKASSSGRKKYDSLFRNSPQESPIAQRQSGSVEPSQPKVKKRSNDRSMKPLLWFQRHRQTSKASLSSSPGISSNEKVPTQGHEPHPVIVPEERESASRGPITVIPPYEDNPEESLSFDEILASFDHYASATGNTTKKRSHGKEKRRVPSPEPKSRKAHKRRNPRYLTISSIDADTMKAVEEALREKESPPPPPPPSKPKTKVHQMAREYSRRIKDHQRRGIFRRYSTVVEEPPDHDSSNESPTWLENLKEIRSRTLSQSSQEERLSPFPEPTKDDLVTVPSTISPSPRLSLDDKHACNSRVQVEISPKLLIPDNPEDSQCRSSKSRALSHPHLPPSSKHPGVHDFNEAEFHKKGGFRGWVKSLVDKFSGSSKDRK